MARRLQKLVQASTKWLYTVTHRQLPPTFVRVAYTLPRRVVLVTTRYEGVEDVWPIDWHTPLSLQPERYGICIYRNSHGSGLLQQSRSFVVHFVPAAWEEIVLACGNSSGRDTDKFAQLGLRKGEAETVPAPRLEGVLGRLECEVERIDDLGDRLFAVGLVKHSELSADAAQLFHLISDVPRPSGGT